MDERTLRKNQRVLSVIEGIFLCLLSIAISMSMGYIMRTLVAGFLTMFGILYHGALFFIFVEGIFLTIRGKFLLPQKKWKYFFIITMILGLLMMVSSIESATFGIQDSTDLIRDFFALYTQIPGGYYSKEYVNFYDYPFGGGLFGYLLAMPILSFTKEKSLLAIIISASIFGASFIILALPYFKLIISGFIYFIKAFEQKIDSFGNKVKVDEPKAKPAKPIKVKKPKKTKEEKLQEKYKYSFPEESNAYLHADEVGADEVTPIMKSNEISRLDFDSRATFDIPENIHKSRPTSETGTLELAKLNLFGEEPKEVKPFEVETVYAEKEEKVSSIDEFEKDQQNDALNESNENASNSVVMNSAPIKEIDPFVEQEEVKQEEVTPVITKEVVNIPNKDILPKEKEKPAEVNTVKEMKTVELTVNHIEWVPPSTDSLVTYQTEEQVQANIDAAKEKQEIVNLAFRDFNVQAEVVDFIIGPSITRLLIDYPSTGSVKAVDKIKLDVSRRLNGIPVRFAETVPGTSYSGFEVPNPVAATVSFKEVFEALPPSEKHPTAVAFGKDIAGNVIYADVADFPHMLVSGTSGSGKSVFVNSLIVTLIARTSPEDLKLVLVDPKRVEMNRYKDEPHLFCPVINDSNEAKVMLYKMVDYMNERYHMFEEADYATSLKDYNKWAKANNRKTMPYIIIVLDEYADLAYSCKEVSVPLVSICQKARAAGIHVIVSTQRPSTDVITGTIKANLQTRVCLTAASSTDSITILDEGGAEDLLGNGDMLVKSPLVSRTGLSRLQGCYVQGGEIAYIVNYLKSHYKPEYEESFLDLSDNEPEPATNNMFNSPLGDSNNEEEKYQWIKEWAETQEYVSMSKIQRECSVGFNRAGKLVRRLQDDGILSYEQEGSNRGFKVISGASRFNEAPIVTSDEVKK